MKALFRLVGVGGLLMAVLGCSGDASDKQSRDAAFQELFGFAPPRDVSDVRSSWRKNFFHYVQWMRVNCGPPTLAKMRSQGKAWPERFVILTVEPGRQYPKVDAPSWWNDATLVAAPERFVLQGTTSSKLDVVYVWVDASAGVVFAARNVAD